MNEECEALKFPVEEDVTIGGECSIVMEISGDNWLVRLMKPVYWICGRQVEVTYKGNGKGEYSQWSLAYCGSHQFLMVLAHILYLAIIQVQWLSTISLHWYAPSIHRIFVHGISTACNAVTTLKKNKTNKKKPGLILLILLISLIHFI